ncbi:SDR family NAD(P)-dependent oxidoreductase [Legionella sp. WA2022007384]
MSFSRINKLQNIVNLLQSNATLYPDNLMYSFVGENETNALTNKQLLQKVTTIASHLSVRVPLDSRALLLLPPGLDYIASFLGCLMSGIIAVPAYPPHNNRHANRVKSIISNANAETLITTKTIADHYPFDNVQIIDIDEIQNLKSPMVQFAEIAEGNLAFLQYTSGSTGSPKGVMVSHGNIIANLNLIHNLCDGQIKTVCSWLPPFHDMGLIGGILYPLAYNVPCILMAPATFLKTPFLWLKTISEYKANISPAPNFAYDLCVNRITEEEKKQLDLSNWNIALNGAEPVNAESLERFSEAFKECGFHAQSFYPAYGMAETTLMISGKKPGQQTKVLHVDKIVLQEMSEIKLVESQQDGTPIVSCGRPPLDHEIKIINPQSGMELEPYQVGEIIVSGPCVTQGYWQRPELTQHTFGLKLSSSDKSFLRTGDLGFIDLEGELFVTGRLKDLIIIRGHNIYPQDIESLVSVCHDGLVVHGCAAFMLEIDHAPELVIVQEIHRHTKDFDSVFKTILECCSSELPVLPARIILIQQATLPKTSSGKVQRAACRQELTTDNLKIIAQWNKVSSKSSPSTKLNTRGLQLWMQKWLANQLHLDAEQIDPLLNFAYYGVDSSLGVQFCGALEKEIHTEVNPSLLWSYSTITQLANYLENTSTNEHCLKKSEPLQSESPDPIAIIGMSCRFPGGANTPEQFWKILSSGKDGLQPIPKHRWDNQLYYDPQPFTAGKIVSSKGGFIDNIDCFDPALFSISRREAEAMDPQHRLLLELTWEALEHAGIPPLSLEQSNTGIFVGISSKDYSQLVRDSQQHFTDAYFGIGNASSAAAGRLAYFLGTHGETLAVDTACSSSLVAVFEACRNLNDKTEDLAIVGGVNCILDPSLSISFSQAGMLSPSNKCQVFDAKADGYVRSEGCGVVILKRLSDAQRDKNRILAVIQSATVNNDGHSNGITAPNPQAQSDLIRHALKLSDLSADQISYIEAHGTGTRLGDPIEFNSLKEVFATGTRESPLVIGSVKSNIGHLEAAAGMAGLIKTILMVQHKEIPANLHFETVNPLIDLEAIPAQVPNSLQSWNTETFQPVRYAGISSFGFTGTNAHLILSEPPSAEPNNELPMKWQRPIHLFTLSAHSPEALSEQRAKLLEFIHQEKQIDIARLCHSLALGRSPLAYRLAFPVSSQQDLNEKLQSNESSIPSIRPGINNKIVFLFTGQGAQYIQMGLELYRSHPLFKAEVDRCDRILAEYLPESLISIMFDEEKASILDQTKYTQPALFVVQYAMAKLWISWGIQPDALIGHSLGECIAATLAGVMSLEDGLKLIAHRGRLMQEQQAGSMLAVYVSSLQADALLANFKRSSPNVILNLAAINSTNQVVFSGELDAILDFDAYCQSLKFSTTKLRVSHAFHSELMRPMLAEFARIAASIEYQEPQITLISNVYGKPIHSITSYYWVEHICATVQFSLGIENLIKSEYQVFIEIGPQPVLLNFVKELHPDPKQALLLASSHKNQANWQTITESLSALYLQGNIIDWRSYDQPFHIQAYEQTLPTYAFQHQSYWLSGDSEFKVREIQDDFIRQSLYKMAWEKIALPSSSPQELKEKGKWLLFINQDRESELLVKYISQFLSDHIVITPSLTYQSTPKSASINPLKMKHFQKLLNEHTEFRGVIYLWGIAPLDILKNSSLSNREANDLKIQSTASCAGLLHLVKTLKIKRKEVVFWTVTRDSTPVQQKIIPFFAPLLGMGKTLQLEYPELNYHHLDVNGDVTPEQMVAKLQQLVIKKQDEFLLALYQDEFLVPRLHQLPFDTKIENKEILCEDGAYLITGGLGGLGLALSKWLVSQQVKTIILLGRRPYSKDIENTINELNAGDVMIEYVQADVSDDPNLRHALSDIHISLSAIKGIFHLAGIVQDGLWENLTWPDFEAVFQAKVEGAWNLHRLSIELMPDLEHFVFFSSISSVLGTLGQANYAAANAFMDNLAHYRKNMGLPALSINFGPWQQVGMTHNLKQSWSIYGINTINEKIGIDALNHMLKLAPTQLCLMPNNIASQLSHLPVYYKKLLADIMPIPSLIDSKLAEQNKGEDIRESFVLIIRKILRLSESDELPMHASLMSLGMDSVLAVELLHQLNNEYSIKNLSIQTLLFENRSISDLIYLVKEQVELPHSEESPHNNLPQNINLSSPHLLQLSVQQIRIWRHIQAQPSSPAYLVTNFIHLEGEINVEHLEKSIQQVIARHPMLRCTFHASLNIPFQFCHDSVDFKLQFLDLSHLEHKEQTRQLKTLIYEINHQQFDLSQAPLLASYLIKRGEQHYVWALHVSHLLTDGGSSLILVQDILHFYSLNQEENNEELAPAVPYQDFIDWQLSQIVDGSFENYAVFWQNLLQNYTPPILPTDKPNPQLALTYGAKEPILIPIETVNALQELVKKNEITLANMLLAIYGILLAHLAQAHEAYVTLLCSGRESEQYHTTIGNIANELPLILNYESDKSFITVAKQVQNEVVKSLPYQYLQPEQMVELDLPVPDVSFDFQNIELNPPNLNFKLKPLGSGQSQIPLWGTNPRKLSLKFNYSNGSLSGYLKYRIDLYDRSTISSLTEQFVKIIQIISKKPEISCGSLFHKL